LVVTAKVRGHSDPQTLPANTACEACWKEFIKYFQILFTWPYYCEKHHGDKDCSATLDLAIKIIHQQQVPNFKQEEVGSIVSTRGSVCRSSVLLTEADLKRESGLTYLPKKLLDGPYLTCQKEHGEGSETCYLFRNEAQPYRVYNDILDFTEERRVVAMPSTHHAWPSMAEEVHQILTRKRRIAENSQQTLEDRLAPLPSIRDWLIKAGVSKPNDTGDGEGEEEVQQEGMEWHALRSPSPLAGIEGMLDLMPRGIATEQDEQQWPEMARGSSSVYATPVASRRRSVKSPGSTTAPTLALPGLSSSIVPLSPLPEHSPQTSSGDPINLDSVSVAPATGKPMHKTL